MAARPLHFQQLEDSDGKGLPPPSLGNALRGAPLAPLHPGARTGSWLAVLALNSLRFANNRRLCYPERSKNGCKGTTNGLSPGP